MPGLSDIVSLLADISPLEKRQLLAILNVELGTQSQKSAPQQTRSSTSKATPTQKSSGKGNRPKRGNPKRKSQHATNPLYQEYSRLKKIVEKQAKDGKTPFSSLRTPEKREYDAALTDWVRAKSSFRGRNTTTNQSETDAAEETEDSEGGTQRETLLSPKRSFSDIVGTDGTDASAGGGNESSPLEPSEPETTDMVVSSSSSSELRRVKNSRTDSPGVNA
jgi:hypothetical protein